MTRRILARLLAWWRSNSLQEWGDECAKNWPEWRCGICGEKPCNGHGHLPVPVGEV